MSDKILMRIDGMSCQHCVEAVTQALSSVPLVKKVKVDLKKGEAKIDCLPGADIQRMKEAVVEAGFTPE